MVELRLLPRKFKAYGVGAPHWVHGPVSRSCDAYGGKKEEGYRSAYLLPIPVVLLLLLLLATSYSSAYSAIHSSIWSL